MLAWIDAYKARWGRWPTRTSGRIDGTLTETWLALDARLRRGGRGLPGGSTLAQVLVEHRGHRDRMHLPRLKVNGILAWADAHRRRTGEWPTQHSGPVVDAPGETWAAIDLALGRCTRGIRQKTTLTALLARRRGRQGRLDRPPLTDERILALAEAHHTLFGFWPNVYSGAVGKTGENWRAIDSALRDGTRGQPGGSSLFQFLKERGKFEGRKTPHTMKK
jgi:hypothetical protein